MFVLLPFATPTYNIPLFRVFGKPFLAPNSPKTAIKPQCPIVKAEYPTIKVKCSAKNPSVRLLTLGVGLYSLIIEVKILVYGIIISFNIFFYHALGKH
jgi:hypothetical protein